MNYRHAFHAGNFADVMKHATVALIIEHLKLKDRPFFVLDTHAGVGAYDLMRGPATRTLEWRQGIGRLLGEQAAPIPDDVAGLLAPYLTVVHGLGANSVLPNGALTSYPGSPVLAAHLLRPMDRLVANELHPDERAQLVEVMAPYTRAQVIGQDGYVALKSQLPPTERRGLVLIDPPFEVEDELAHLITGLTHALARFATGTYVIWYPIKALAPVGRFHQQVRQGLLKPALIAEIYLQAPLDPTLLNGCGLLIVNPPYQLSDKLSRLMPWLSERLAQGPGARSRVSKL